MSSGVPLGPTVAVVVMFDSAMATLGTTATLPPAAPVLACVVMPCEVVAASVTLRPPMSTPVSSAVVVSSTIATATEAPTPTLDAPDTPPVDSSGSAFVSLVACDVAVIATSAPTPVPAVRMPASRAVVSMFSMSMATDPATPTDPPPAPLVAEAPSSCVEPMSASIVAPTE